MRTQFPRTETVRREALVHQAARQITLRRISASIDDFLKEKKLELALYSIEKRGDYLYISSVDGENIDKLSAHTDNLLKHLNTNGFDLKGIVLEKRTEN